MLDPEKAITPEGVGFIKTATAAPDFQSTKLEGIPDAYNGPTIVKKDYMLETIECTQGQSTYYVIPPCGGVAYFAGSTPFGTHFVNNSQMAGVPFPDATDIFDGVGSNATAVNNTTNVDKGRLMALSAELVCLNNAFNQYGSIACWKTPLTQDVGLDIAGPTALVEDLKLTGVGGVTKVSLGSGAYVQPVRAGAYSVSMNREEEFLFYPVRDNVNDSTKMYSFMETESGSSIPNKMQWEGATVIWDNGFDSIVFRVDVPASATILTQSFVLKIWKAWEYQPVFNSLLYNMSQLSPLPSRDSLTLYREIERQLPTAVPAKDNPDFWSTVLGLVDEASSILSYVPGPVGAVAKGVHAVSSILTERSVHEPALRRRTKKKSKAKPKIHRKKKRRSRR